VWGRLVDDEDVMMVGCVCVKGTGGSTTRRPLSGFSWHYIHAADATAGLSCLYLRVCLCGKCKVSVQVVVKNLFCSCFTLLPCLSLAWH
jgi:hypothetical protein